MSSMKMNFMRKLFLLVITIISGTLASIGQEKLEVEGVVVSMANNTPLSDISVTVINAATEPVLTDSTGHFSLSVPNGQVSLEFSYPGLKTIKVFLDNQQAMIVKMGLENDYWFQDKINTPLGFKSNQYFTGSKSFINKTELGQLHTASLDSRIQGQAAGVRVIDYSGSPGAGASVLVRGASTIEGGTQPLYVLDGMVLPAYQMGTPLATGAVNNPLADLSPEDIKSLTVLKDAASASFYGVRGANGIVLIETNKGTSGETKLSFDSYWGISRMMRNYEMMDKSQFKSYYKDLRYKSGLTVSDFADNYGTYFYEDRDSKDYYRYSNNTDWQDEVTELGTTQNYHLNLQGGDQVTTYAFSTSFFNQKGVVSSTDFSRFSIDFNLLYKVSPKVRFGNVVNFSHTNKNLMDEGINPYSNPLFTGLIKSPMLAPFIFSPEGVKLDQHEDQDFFNISNPSHITSNLQNEVGVNRFIGNLFLEMDMHKNLMSKVSLGIDYNRQTEKRFYPDYGLVSTSNASRYSEGKTYNRFLIQADALINYKKQFNNIHDLDIVAGVQYTNQDIDFTYGKSINSAADYFTTLSKGEADSLNSDNRQSILGSAYSKLSYALKDRYLLSANVRADGSSKFGDNNRYGIFYGTSVGWRIGAEPFLRNVKFINELKLKASYGLSGNENIRDFAAYSLYGGTAYNLRGATKPVSLGNKDLKWETTNQVDFGLEFLGFNSRFGLDVDFYLKKTEDLFYVQSLPNITGYCGYLSNLGDIENKGVDVSVFVRPIDKALRYETQLNIGVNRNKVTSLPDGDFSSSYNAFIGLAREGQPLGAFLGYEAIGIYDNEDQITVKNGPGYQDFQPGDVIFKDRVKDNVINEKDMAIIGDPNPDFHGSWLNSISYKNIRFDLNLTFAYGNEVINTTRSKLESMSGDYNQTTAVLRAWQNTGDAATTNVPRVAYADPSGNSRNSSRWVEDGSFIKIQSATITYDLGKKLLNETLFKSIEFYVKGQNLYTFSKYLGYSPDFVSGYNPLLYGVDMGAYPMPATIFLGVKLGL